MRKNQRMIKNYNDYIKESVARNQLKQPTDDEVKEAEEYLEKGIDASWDIDKFGYFSVDVSGKYSVYYTLWKINRLNSHFISNLSTDFMTAIEKAKKAAGRIPVIIDKYGTKAGMFQAAKKEMFSFGKYRGQTLGEVFVEDPKYIIWTLEKYTGSLSPEFIEKAKYYKDLYYDTIRKKNLEESKSEYIGKIGDKIKIEADVYDVEANQNPFDNKLQYKVKLIDDQGNKYMTYNIGSPIKDGPRIMSPVKKGDTVKLTAKVKDHKEFLGIKFTLLYYCKILQRWNLEEDMAAFNL